MGRDAHVALQELTKLSERGDDVLLPKALHLFVQHSFCKSPVRA